MLIPNTNIDIQETKDAEGHTCLTVYEWVELTVPELEKPKWILEGWTLTERNTVGRWILRFHGRHVRDLTDSKPLEA